MVKVHYSSLRPFNYINVSGTYAYITSDKLTCEYMSTITTPFGLFAYNFLPFGLSVSPSIFQKTINGIIGGIDGIVAYQDDVIGFATDQVTLLDSFIQYNVRIND